MSFLASAGAIRQRISLRKLLSLVTSRTGVLGLTSVGNLVVRTGSSMLLTRILTPSDFGIVGIITAVFYTVTMITDLGFEGFLIRHERTDDRHFRDVIWTIHAKRGLLLSLAVAIMSPVIARTFGKPVVALPLAVASLTFAINGLASLSMVTALRRDKARELSLLEFGLQIFQTVFCVLLALWWRNAWSLIAVMVLQSAIRAVLSYSLFADSRQRLARDGAISREFLAWSRIVLMSSTLSLLIGQSDKLILGRLFTLAEFGLYAIALTIASAPATFADAYVRRVVFPLYAQIWRQSPAEIPAIYYRVRRIPSALYGFGCGGLIGGAALLVQLLYDPRYAGAAAFISLLAVGSALRLPNLAAAELLTAIGDIKGTLRINVVRVLWLSVSIPCGFILGGTIGVVAAVGFMEVPAMLYSWLFLQRLQVLRMREELLFLLLAGLGTAVGFVIAQQTMRFFPHL